MYLFAHTGPKKQKENKVRDKAACFKTSFEWKQKAFVGEAGSCFT